jgi:uncharacterized phiE125 gp8 family phage protein
MPETILITAPAVEPVTLSEAKLQCRVDSDLTADDALLQALIVSARERCEHATGRRLITQVRDMVLDAFPPDGEAIKLHPDLVAAQAVVHIQYLDTAGQVQTVDSVTYDLDALSLPGYVFPATGAAWPVDVAESANAIKVRVRCGYGDAAADVPVALRTWILMDVATAYKHREGTVVGVSVAELPNRYVDALLDPFRVYAH